MATDEERAAKRLATLLQQSKVTLVYREPGHENSVNAAGNDYRQRDASLPSGR